MIKYNSFITFALNASTRAETKQNKTKEHETQQQEKQQQEKNREDNM